MQTKHRLLLTSQKIVLHCHTIHFFAIFSKLRVNSNCNFKLPIGILYTFNQELLEISSGVLQPGQGRSKVDLRYGRSKNLRPSRKNYKNLLILFPRGIEFKNLTLDK